MVLQVIEARIQTAWPKNVHLTERTSLVG